MPAELFGATREGIRAHLVSSEGLLVCTWLLPRCVTVNTKKLFFSKTVAQGKWIDAPHVHSAGYVCLPTRHEYLDRVWVDEDGDGGRKGA